MFKNLKVFIGVLLLSAVMAGCDEGKFNDLSCDDSYKDECIAYDYFATCQNNVIVTAKCPEANFCFTDANGDSRCILAKDENAPMDGTSQGNASASDNGCTEGSTQCDGNYVQMCTSQQWIKMAEECANGCADGACL